ncbi:excisionase [Pseudomonas aeruginosa]|nr:excisionase [Pseudomonas aeruginosa]ASP14437.1 excisionase [Pseudomonas aeruginosa]KYO81164.1 hypothetical protein LL05_04934 [Pseudomonas aeruginosa]OZO12992.1 excisionase [Pseudomonas aeruginosa]OZO18662.1 excisionase [Pseudomonas aeruginosa]
MTTHFLGMPRWVLIKRAAELTGYSKDAITHKVKNGTWPQGRIWRKARDGRIFINIEEIDRWVESAPQDAA